MHSCWIAFVLSDIAYVILNLIPDDISTSIYEVVCHANGLLTRTTYHSIKGLGNWLQASFTARETGAYLEGLI